MLQQTPIFSAQTDPTQWDHKSPISWGSSEYLRFSGRWPFGCLAGRFMAAIAQRGPFGVQKCCFLAPNQFFVDSLKKDCYNHDGTPKRQPFCVVCIACWSAGGRQSVPFLGSKLALIAKSGPFDMIFRLKPSDSNFYLIIFLEKCERIGFFIWISYRKKPIWIGFSIWTSSDTIFYLN